MKEKKETCRIKSILDFMQKQDDQMKDARKDELAI